MTFRVWEAMTEGTVQTGWGMADPSGSYGFVFEKASVDLNDHLVAAPKILADGPAELFYASEDNSWDLSTAFGPLRPPFRLQWIEWKSPPRWRVDGTWGNALHDAGFAIVETRPEGELHLVRLQGGWLIRKRLVWFPGSVNLAVTEDGSYVDGSIGVMCPDADPRYDGFSVMFYKPALLALSLMNCRNITITDTDRPVKKRARKPGGPASYSYHVIKLPQSVTSMRSARTGMGGGVPIHITRGHFKTYTDDAPLFGQHVGTWWWHDHVKGDPNRGVSAHDYEL